MNLPKLPLDVWIDAVVDWLKNNIKPFFDLISTCISSIVSGFDWIFSIVPAWIMIIVFTVLAFLLSRWTIALFTFIGFLLIWNLDLWEPTMQTLSLVLTSALISIIFGIPIGIACAASKKVQNVVTPVLDFMQTMPAFVYLLPAVIFFRLGAVPGVIAAVIFAIPPTIRMTNLGIRQVPRHLVEAADAFGSTAMQKLIKLELPLAVPTIMAGINQTIMLSLSMVVIASMIGAQGIGEKVLSAVQRLETGKGFEAGLAIVILAVVLDRITQSIVNKRSKGSESH
ncbi:glycine/betaine ABC transporter permease [Insulibacter thermoxylanivorax]|uniref:Glycine/betaine ABC transporter permease n=1 Tax=Insulibacter thermoxylanivorax TaxID=2749268 RepID=A0A916QD04_9BACL|nr:proline/glycine betaine ABC transporter permease [Insulibacter thermoxylanivorax]GFR37108.1 glycine/betaine ABC transporter permease [Insulibacter thermoxylanivorax]